MRPQRTRTALATMSLTMAGAALVVGHHAATAAGPGGQLVAASAGTLVYVKNDNIWISRPDGSGQRQVTTDGTSSWPYSSPSMADDGTIAAGHEGQIVRMRQGGTLLNRFTPRALKGSLTNLGQVAISPNGATIAYSMVNTGCTGSGCSTATGYTAPDRATDPEVVGSPYATMPSWVGSGRTLQSGGAGAEVTIHDLGHEPEHWFDSADGLTDVELSPDGRRLAGAAGYQGADGISSYDVVGNATTGSVPPAPTWRCRWSDDDGGALVGPTWGPDSKALAFQADNGVWIADDVTVGCDSVEFDLVVPGATGPDWSAAAYNPETQQTTGPTSTVSPTATTDPDPRPDRAFSVSGGSMVTGKPRVGKKVAVQLGKVSPRPTKISFQWKINGTSIKKATKRVYLVKRGDRRKALSVSVTLRRAGYDTKRLVIRAGRVR